MFVLRERQDRILRFIESFYEQNSYPPTIRDIQKACSISSTSVVNYNLNLLEKAGYLKRAGNISRGIELVGKNSNETIPILGSIAAGEPLGIPGQDSWGIGDPIDSVDLSPEFFGNKKDIYALKVKGTSMIDALVDDGDTVIIEPITSSKNGDMVVAWLKLEEAVTLKRIYKEGDRVRLQPANPLMDPIYVKADNLIVQGKVIGIIRHLG